MTRTLRPLVALALAGLIGLVGAGCGSDTSSKTGSASSTGTTRSGDEKLTKQEKAVKFAECMRANGDSNFGVDVTREVWRRPSTPVRP